MVLVSTGGVVALLRSADSSVVVMAAGSALDAGTTVHASDLVPVRVRIEAPPTSTSPRTPPTGSSSPASWARAS